MRHSVGTQLAVSLAPLLAVVALAFLACSAPDPGVTSPPGKLTPIGATEDAGAPVADTGVDALPPDAGADAGTPDSGSSSDGAADDGG
jgi:hypothetical protein